MKFIFSKKGQTSVEYAVVIIIVIASFLAMQNYMKRGIQGKWRDAVDDLGDQYDPSLAISDVRHTLASSTNTQIYLHTDVDTGELTTIRTDVSVSSENKQGTQTIAGD